MYGFSLFTLLALIFILYAGDVWKRDTPSFLLMCAVIWLAVVTAHNYTLIEQLSAAVQTVEEQYNVVD